MNVLREGSTGPQVELLQSSLRKLGFYLGKVDGKFGSETKNAVIAFQNSIGLSADGIVGPRTWQALAPYINGYTLYKIQARENFYSIASMFGTTVNSLIFANPQVDYNNLQIGQTIIVPFETIVPTDISYTSQILNMNINSLKTVYPFLQIRNIGISNLGTSIPAIRFGTGAKEVLYVGSTHSNEWITTTLLMKFLEILSKSYVNSFNIFGISARDLFSNVSLYIVPMLNPDGVDLVTNNLPKNSYGYTRAEEISKNFPDIPFPSGWKANIEGVDLKNLQPFFIIDII